MTSSKLSQPSVRRPGVMAASSRRHSVPDYYPSAAWTLLCGRSEIRGSGPPGLVRRVRVARVSATPEFAAIRGTGVGVGLVIGDRLVCGLSHTELGHIRIARPAADRWPGVCAFHGDCVEGLASGPAIEARAGASAADLSPEHAVWGTVAHALGQLLHTLVLATAPRRILLGGGVMDAQPHLFPRVREALRVSLNGYVQASELGPAIGHYVVPPGLGAAAGAMGALALAAAAQGAR